jgi:hypothetical protein
VFSLVNSTASYVASPVNAASIGARSVTGRMLMSGSSIGIAPRRRTSVAVREAWLSLRGTNTRLANSGSASNQLIVSRSRTTSPTITSAGVPMPASRTRSAMSASVPITTRCSGLVADWITAAGVAGERSPNVTSALASDPSRARPIKITTLPVCPRSSAKSKSAFSRVVPLKNTTLDAKSRCVRLMPA